NPLRAEYTRVCSILLDTDCKLVSQPPPHGPADRGATNFPAVPGVAECPRRHLSHRLVFQAPVDRHKARPWLIIESFLQNLGEACLPLWYPRGVVPAHNLFRVSQQLGDIAYGDTWPL